MKPPIILINQHNLAVLPEFDGNLVDGIASTRHNLRDNRIRCVIDSNADLWVFSFVGSSYYGLRKLFSTLFWNVSQDRYTYTREENISVGQFRKLVAPHQNDQDPDRSELAAALIEPVVACDAKAPLRSHMHLLNL